MKIIGITIVTRPAYRQDPWRENIMQQLMLFDEVVVVYGAVEDKALFNSSNFTEGELARIHTAHMHWPQPDWTYEELPKHLNYAISTAKEHGADWIVKLDSDMFIHENDRAQLYAKLHEFNNSTKNVAVFEKYQFFKSDRCYEKGKMQLAFKANSGLCYGRDSTRYTDLCQLIAPSKTVYAGDGTVPDGLPVDAESVGNTGIHVWNYDYTFKTEARSRELLYYFDRAHAAYWGKGYSGLAMADITQDSAFDDYMKIVAGRIKKCNKIKPIEEHPFFVQRRMRKMDADEFGYNLWGRIKI